MSDCDVKITRREFGADVVAIIATTGVDAIAAGLNEANEANVSKHLNVAGRVNLGSFYTPAKYVSRVAEWLRDVGINEEWVIADLSCGYGAFFELADIDQFARCKFVGNDIDGIAVNKAKEMFPFVHFRQENALADVRREKFGIADNERVVVVGNPPYNDVTSQINQGIKTNDTAMDDDIKTRDLGMSSLLAYNKIRADYVAVLHPLSYLIKKANFKATRRFFENYEMLRHVIFSSQEFAGTSKIAGFPVIVALYRRTEPGKGLTYSDVCNMRFTTIEGADFSVAGFDYVDEVIKKYPHKGRYNPEILFYTMRDINALKRSRTFIKDRIANAVDVDPVKLPYYCYVDCFKRYADVPYWMGNFNVPFIKGEFDSIASAVVADAKFNNQDVFGKCDRPSDAEVQLIRTYINKVVIGNGGYYEKSKSNQ